MALSQPQYDPSSLPSRASRSDRRLSRQSPPAEVVSLPNLPAHKPVWLRGLRAMQTASTALVAVAAVATVGFYASTVKTQDTFRQQYRHLEQLQRDSSAYQLIEESMANAMRDSAVMSDMVPHSHDRIVELEPAPARPQQALSDSQLPPGAAFPAGY